MVWTDYNKYADSFLMDLELWMKQNPEFDNGMLCDVVFEWDTQIHVVRIIERQWEDHEWSYIVEARIDNAISYWKVLSRNLVEHVGGFKPCLAS